MSSSNQYERSGPLLSPIQANKKSGLFGPREKKARCELGSELISVGFDDASVF